ncbi:MAG: glycosyltransferase [Planctomycetes bacterium]|nr:glycosyltransferase [Planctomycetota bacterium]
MAAGDLPPTGKRPLRVGFLGGVAPHKGLGALVDALGTLEREGLHARLFAPGCGAADLPHANVPAFLASIDLLAIPSLWNETGPIVLLEAISTGTPVVAPRRGGIAELMSGREGHFLYDPADPRGLLTALRAAAGGVCARLPPDAAVRTVADAADDFEAIYRGLWRAPAGEKTTVCRSVEGEFARPVRPE